MTSSIDTRARIINAGMLPMYAIVAMMFVATFFTFLQTDDFCTYGRVLGPQGGNPFAETLNLYRNWTGRYASSFLISLTASSSQWIPVWMGYSLTLAAYMAVFAWACVRISGISCHPLRANPILAVIMLCSTLVIMPSKLEQFFWVTGAAVYFIGASLLLLLLVRLASDAPRGNGSKNWRGEVWTNALVVLVAGTNELLCLIAGACLLWAYLTEMRARRARHSVHLARIVIYVAALLVTVLAPGNFVRDAASSVATRHHFGPATLQTIGSLRDFVHALVSENLVPLAVALVGSMLAGAVQATTTPSRRAQEWMPYAIAMVAAFPTQVWTYSFLTGEVAPGRVINQALLLAMIGACVISAWLGGRYGQGLARRLPPTGIAVFLAVAGVALAISPPSRSFAHSLVTFAPRWHAEQLERHGGLAALHGTPRTAYVKPFDLGDSAPPTFQGGDVTEDGNNWINRCVASYYGVPNVIKMRRMAY